MLREGGTLRQISAPETFEDIITLDPYAYTINFYQPSERGEKEGAFYQVATGATPFISWTIENPDKSDTVFNRIRITEERGNSTKIFLYTRDASNNTWSLGKGNGLQTETKHKLIVNGNLVITDTLKRPDGAIASKTRTTRHIFAWGEEIIETVVDPDNGALTTITIYYDHQDENGYGKIKSRVNPDGSWGRYTSDAQGRKADQRFRPVQNHHRNHRRNRGVQNLPRLPAGQRHRRADRDRQTGNQTRRHLLFRRQPDHGQHLLPGGRLPHGPAS